MKRRGFLGFLGGAAVAGPSMVKQAAAATMADLNVSALSGGVGLGYDGPSPYGQAVLSAGGPNDWAIRNLTKLIGRTAEQHAYHRRRMTVHTLDPDLASYRSLALHQKIRLQRDREYARHLEGERSYLEAHIAGWFNDHDW